MSPFRNRIITASAGTGKTFRLASEYIKLLLSYYEAGDFKLDNILVLTFTRKATAEIRDRIVEHLQLLCSTASERKEERRELIASLGLGEFGMRQQNILLSAWAQLSADRKQLQVMTIDAYINSIFRNIVRPLRSIDSFEIDQQAVDKRLPFLLKHLMTPQLKHRVDKLLRRKVSPSLDDYRHFFKSLIEARWLQFLISKRLAPAGEGTLQLRSSFQGEGEPESSRQLCLDCLQEYLELMVQGKQGEKLEDLFGQPFRALFVSFPAAIPGVFQQLTKLCATPQGCYKLFQILKKNHPHNGNKYRKDIDKPVKERLLELVDLMLTRLANHLMLTLFLVEQQEIITLWQEILAEYDRLIYRYKNMTYSDVSWFSLEALFSEEPPPFELSREGVANEFYQFLSHRSRFLLIDEFQDTSLLQFNILKPIIEEVISGEGSKDFGGLVVVGDEKQSIFSWRGGERDLLLNLRTIFPALGQVESEQLLETWRSSPTLIQFINSVFLDSQIHNYLRERNLNWEYPPIASARPALEPKSLIQFMTRAFQNNPSELNLDAVYREFVANTVKPAVDAHHGESVAILCRKTRELGEMQKILDECGVTSIFQPSSTLDQHAWIAPLITWLRFVAFGDWVDFLAVLRSNYIMLKAAPLKAVVDEISRSLDQGLEPEFACCRVAQELYLLSRLKDRSVSEQCRLLPDLCLAEKQLHERDYLNLHAFLKAAQVFEQAREHRDKAIPAFLDYLEDNREQEFMKQVAVEGSDQLQLLTIHKSKGLQFDRVFVFYNLDSGKGNESKRLNWYMDWADESYRELRDFALTYHYEDILRRSDYKGLAELADNRALLEEMNTLYVAFTRAKTALQICFAYRGNGSWEDYYAHRDEKEKLKLPILICDAGIRFFAAKGIEATGNGNFVLTGKAAPVKEDKPGKREAVEQVTVEELASALPPLVDDPLSGLVKRSIDEHLDLKQIWLTDRHNLIGDLAHHYLSFILHNTADEHYLASQECLVRFCSILTQAEILDLIERLRSELKGWPILFEPRWDKVYTEFTIYHQGRELRLDRLMLDSKGNEALIVDFKTGGIEDRNQLNDYATALAATEVFRQRGIRIETEYIKLKLV